MWDLGRHEVDLCNQSIPFGGMRIVHLETVNILLAVKVFRKFWNGKCVLMKCDNQAVVAVLQSGWPRNPFLVACERNISYIAGLDDVDLQYIHVLGKNNKAADLLSRWIGSCHEVV